MAVKRSPTGAGARLYVADGSTTVTDLHGLGTFVDKYNPTPAELVARDSEIAEWASWVLTCPVNVDHTGGTETADDSDRCNPDATIVTKVTSEITFNFRKKKDSSSALPNWVRFLRAAWKSGGLVHLMMLDAPKTQDGADGFWMIAQVTDYSESQQLTEGIEISCTVRPGSTPTDLTGVPYLNWDVMTVSVP
ncbi:MAG: hypothetical protein U0795_20190 [Pirellulales bacterium]